MEIDRLKDYLKKLSLSTILSIFEEEAKKSAKMKMSYTGYLGRLVEEEILAKTDRSIQKRISNAKFPFVRTIEDFDFSFQPTINEVLVKELAELSFLEKAENICLLGPPGTGKTHLSIAIGIKACISRKRVLFCKVLPLMEELIACCVTRTLPARLESLSRLDLLILDELGYDESLDKRKANLFFQLISARYERGSIILTSNKPFEEWGGVLGDEVVASAILDRLLHHSHIVAINGPSFRLKDKLKEK